MPRGIDSGSDPRRQVGPPFDNDFTDYDLADPQEIWSRQQFQLAIQALLQPDTHERDEEGE